MRISDWSSDVCSSDLKLPGDPGVSSALTDLLPMTVIATEQSRDRGDFDEAQRLYALIEKADKDHPSLARLKSSVAAAEQAATERAEQQRLSAEQEADRKSTRLNSSH